MPHMKITFIKYSHTRQMLKENSQCLFDSRNSKSLCGQSWTFLEYFLIAIYFLLINLYWSAWSDSNWQGFRSAPQTRPASIYGTTHRSFGNLVHIRDWFPTNSLLSLYQSNSLSFNGCWLLCEWSTSYAYIITERLFVQAPALTRMRSMLSVLILD